MKNKAIFLDRDGTINVEKHYLYKKDEFEFLPGVIDGLALLQNAGFLLFIITNQSGIGRGYYSEEDFNILNNWMIKILRMEGIYISKVYYCPHLPDAPVKKYRMVCSCRKPAVGMYKQAIEEFNVDISGSWAIGDKIRDCSICREMGCKGFLIANNEKPDIIKAVKNNEYRNINYAMDLFHSSRKIIANMEE